MNFDLLLNELSDGIGQMFIGDGILPILHPHAVGDAQNISQAMSFGRNELKTRHLKQLTVRVTEVDRVHEATVDWAGILNAVLL
jgi:hypothetical protein